MTLVGALLAIIIIGVVLYLIETYIPMSAPIKVVFRVIIVLIACAILLDALGFNVPLRLR